VYGDMATKIGVFFLSRPRTKGKVRGADIGWERV